MRRPEELEVRVAVRVVRTYCLARAIEANDNDGKLVLPVRQRVEWAEKSVRVSYLVKYS